MAVKSRILLLRDYLQENSDEKHPLKTAEIRKYLQENGCPVSVQTLRTDIQSLADTGYGIRITEEQGKPTTYSWMKRKWSVSEIQILTDAVSASQAITPEESEELIGKLAALAGPSALEELLPPVIISERNKSSSRNMSSILEETRKAIRNNRKIKFDYGHNCFKTKKSKRNEIISKSFTWNTHTVSPYATVWNNDKYYLVGWDDNRDKIVPFRIDRMRIPETLTWLRKPVPKDFSVQDYADKVFGMFEGPEETVTLRCRHSILDQVFDKFGENIPLENITKSTFDITIPVSVSGTFYSWVFQFVGEMNIIAPGNVKDAYADYLQEAIDDVLGT